MYATTFSTIESATETVHYINVDRANIGKTAQWLAENNCYEFVCTTNDDFATFQIADDAIEQAVVDKLNAKFNPEEEEEIIPQFCRTLDGNYELTVPNKSAIATTQWLESKHCLFDRHITDSTTRYTFIIIPMLVVDTIAKKYDLDDEAYYSNEVEDGDTIVRRFVDSLEYSHCNYGFGLPEGGIYRTRVFVNFEVASALGFDKQDGCVFDTQYGTVTAIFK